MIQIQAKNLHPQSTLRVSPFLGRLVLPLAILLILLGVVPAPVHADVLAGNNADFTISRFLDDGTYVGQFNEDVEGVVEVYWSGLFVDADGSVYSAGTSRITKYSPSGALVWTEILPFAPGGIAVGADGAVYVTYYFSEGTQSHIYRYLPTDRTLEPFSAATGCVRAHFLAIRPGPSGDCLYFSSFADGKVRRVSHVGEEQDVISGQPWTGFIGEATRGVLGIALDSDGSLYAANGFTRSVARFSAASQDPCADPYESDVVIASDLSDPHGIALGPSGELFVANYASNSIQRVTPLGLVEEFAAVGLSGPTDVAYLPVPAGRLPGDCNQDRRLNIADAICMLGVLFLGSPEGFPCGDGRSSDPGNLALLDWQPDGELNVSDPIALLTFLFLGGPAHPLADARNPSTIPVVLEECP